MSIGASKRASYEDVLAAPEGTIAEVIDGALHLQPRPKARHAIAAARLEVELGDAFWRARSGPGGWVLCHEPELHLGDEPDIVVPDLAGWRRDRYPESSEAFFTVAPDWVCEVLSPSTATRDRTQKLPLYAGAGVGWVWLVDPDLRLLEAYARDGQGWRLLGAHAESTRARVEPFDAIELELSLLWSATE